MSSIDILVPDLPESVADATVTAWHKTAGDTVQLNEVLVEIETDKVVLEVQASKEGKLTEIVQAVGATVLSRQILGRITPCKTSNKLHTKTNLVYKVTGSLPSDTNNLETVSKDDLGLAMRELISEHDLDATIIKGKCENNHITNADLEAHLVHNQPIDQSSAEKAPDPNLCTRYEKRVPMTRLRKRIAERLLETKNSAAVLTTFNEINMKPIIDLRNQYGEAFKKRHGLRLGFMSFYLKAVVEALKRYPEINASIDGFDVLYHNYFDVSIALSTPRGLVTPVICDVDRMSMADIENKIQEFAIKGREGTLTVAELRGGNFTITNGGIFGSLISTPIINPPQSAILGMHAIKDRPIALNGEVVIQPMMYLALSYDHRLIDGKEAVGYLVTVKNMLEDPVYLLLDI
ncbi:Dihydrolipoyllysine-residue succinyltransferase component of 2-oxoglutarate dehydrogenase complex [Serratia symbiotica]|nr:Dihydrolipoyllysine-residue succinyltransferase component of 2-oxoglutarate dehydrogenase complex [Serratia symbiotica]